MPKILRISVLDNQKRTTTNKDARRGPSPLCKQTVVGDKVQIINRYTNVPEIYGLRECPRCKTNCKVGEVPTPIFDKDGNINSEASASDRYGKPRRICSKGDCRKTFVLYKDVIVQNREIFSRLDKIPEELKDKSLKDKPKPTEEINNGGNK